MGQIFLKLNSFDRKRTNGRANERTNEKIISELNRCGNTTESFFKPAPSNMRLQSMVTHYVCAVCLFFYSVCTYIYVYTNCTLYIPKIESLATDYGINILQILYIYRSTFNRSLTLSLILCISST